LIEMMLSSLLRASSCRALAGACSGAAALAGTRASVFGRRHYLAPSLLAGLDAYGEQFGHVRVPQKFVVPDADGWPEEARGLELGLQVSGLRKQKKRGTLPQDDMAQLEARSFVWNLYDWKWQCVLQSLQAYQEVHGDLEVPKRFLVPSEAPWPEVAWGMKLGFRVSGIRSADEHVKHRPERRAELDALGFVWDDREQRWKEVHAALLAYQEVHGDLEVPQSFVVPSEAPWPDGVWGMKLGQRVHHIRASEQYVKHHPERRAELDVLGFVWDDRERRWEEVRAALLVYKEVHGNLEVPTAFVVPSEAPWPEEAWGMQLGSRMNDIRSKEHYVKDHPERRAELDALGFVWDDLERRWEEVRAALLVYKEVHGNLKVTRAFVVLSEAPWPEEAWGMKLGYRVRDIRHSEHFAKHHPERRAELDALGFVWDDLERRWEEVHAALLAYQQVHGDLEVPQAFVVPSEAPWPEDAWGMMLGLRVNNIRHREDHVKDRPERHAELDALGFRWNSLAS
jgi:hypothetical protein